MPKDQDPRDNDYRAPRQESFDVVLVKNGVGTHAAGADDFKRVNVTTTEGAYGARSLPEVEEIAKTGYTVVNVVAPGRLTEGEQQARQRKHDETYGAFDRSKI